MMGKIYAAALVAALAGCASVPTPPTLPEGDKPTEAEMLTVIHQQLRKTLKDYDSIKDFALVEGPVLAYAIYGVGGRENLWIACVQFNAKNSYGAYTGLKPHSFYMRRIEGEVVNIAPIAWQSVSRTC